MLVAGFVAAAAAGPFALALAPYRPGPLAGAAVVAPAGWPAVAGPVLAAVAAVAAVLLAGLAADVVKLRRVKRDATPLGIAAVRRAAIGMSPTVSTPTAIGYVHPAVVVPVDFRDRVDAREWDAVVAHECAHLARLDDWAKGVQSAVVRLGWWMPGLWILSRALDLERELASDEQAAATTGSRAYAACLLRLATDRGAAHAPAFGARRAHVAIRVERLLRPSPVAAPVVRAVALGVSTAAAFAAVAAAVLAVPGSHAGPAPSPHRSVTVARAAHPTAHHAVAARSGARKPAAVALMLATPPAPRGVLVEPVRTPAPKAHLQPHPFAGVRTGRHAVPHRLAAVQPVETIAFVPAPRRCTSCVGPLRSPDAPALPDGGSPRPATGSAPAVATVAADDPSASGPVTLDPRLFWARLPIRSLISPSL